MSANDPKRTSTLVKRREINTANEVKSIGTQLVHADGMGQPRVKGQFRDVDRLCSWSSARWLVARCLRSFACHPGSPTNGLRRVGRTSSGTPDSSDSSSP